MLVPPVAHCEVHDQFVSLDQSRQQCAESHRCAWDQICPNERLFAYREHVTRAHDAGDAPALLRGMLDRARRLRAEAKALDARRVMEKPVFDCGD